LNEAIKAAMTAKKVDLLLQPDAVLARENNADITHAVVPELNRILPSVSTAVPAGYNPGQLVQQRPQQLLGPDLSPPRKEAIADTGRPWSEARRCQSPYKS